jgi:hypothetical protein
MHYFSNDDHYHHREVHIIPSISEIAADTRGYCLSEFIHSVIDYKDVEKDPKSAALRLSLIPDVCLVVLEIICRIKDEAYHESDVGYQQEYHNPVLHVAPLDLYQGLD